MRRLLTKGMDVLKEDDSRIRIGDAAQNKVRGFKKGRWLCVVIDPVSKVLPSIHFGTWIRPMPPLNL